MGNCLLMYKTLMSDFQDLKGAYERAGEGLLKRACSDRRRGNGFKLKEVLFRLAIRSKMLEFFIMTVVKQWERLPRAVVDGPSLEEGNVSLDWGSEPPLCPCLLQLKMSLLIEEGLEQRNFEGPFQLKLFYDPYCSSRAFSFPFPVRFFLRLSNQEPENHSCFSSTCDKVLFVVQCCVTPLFYWMLDQWKCDYNGNH